MTEFSVCLFCGGNLDQPDHLKYCDGRQGGLEEGPLGHPTRPPRPTLPFTGNSVETLATSKDAATSKLQDAATERLRVLVFLRSTGAHGATDDEMQAALGMEGNTQRPRRIELLRMGCVALASYTRPTRAGRRAAVWHYVQDMPDARRAG